MVGSETAPLAGVRVLDGTHGIAGPIAAMLLADAGADVIRASATSSDSDLSGGVMWDRNKRIVPAARAAALIADADVVITADTAAVDEVLSRARADSVRLHLPAWSDDPNADPITLDRMAQAEYGIAMRQTSFSGGPIDGVYPFLTYMQGAWGATACVAALVERARTGRGQTITVDPLHAAEVVAAPTMVAERDVPLPPTDVGPAGFNPLFGTYECADGQWIGLGALGAKFQDIMFAILGTEDILDDAEVAARRELIYAPVIRDRVRARLAEACRLQPRDRWLTRLAEAGCPVSAVEHRDALLDHPQVAALEQFVRVEDPERGAVVMGGTPVTFDADTGRFAARAFVPDATWPPRPNRTQAAEPDRTDASTAEARGPLAGIRVLNLGTVLAGPYTGMLMAALGADVVKIEVPEGDEFRLRNYMVNRGMRSLAIDLRDPAAYARFLDVVAVSDAVLDNFRPGVLERLKVDRAELSRVNPDIVTSTITGYGGVGPLGPNPGYDPVLQAVSGIMRAQGGADEPVFSAIAVHDVSGACLSAFGACVGLYQRYAGRGGLAAATSLFAASVFMQSNELIRVAGRRAAETGARDYRGPSALSRYYRCADGWIRLYAHSVEVLAASGLACDATESDEALVAAVSAALAEWSRSDAVTLLRNSGALVAVVRDNKELLLDPATRASGHLGSLLWPDGSETFVPRQLLVSSAHPEPPVLTAPGIGEHSTKILAAAGVDPQTITELMASGAIAEREPLQSVAFTGYR